MAKMAQIKMPDGQTFPLENEIAESDDLLRTALKSAYPDYANATFTREGGTDGKELVVKVIKRAGTKGGYAVAALLSAPESVNPAIVMQRRIAELDTGGAEGHLKMLALKPEIDQAIIDGHTEVQVAEASLKALFSAPAEASSIIPKGF